MMIKFGAAAFLAAVVAAADGKDFNAPDYIALSRKAKSDKIWAKVIENTTSGWWHL